MGTEDWLADGDGESTFREGEFGAETRSEEPALSVVEFAREKLGFFPDLRQVEVLESGARRGILNCSRQWGKSTVAAVMALHTALSEAEALVVVGSPTERQSAEFLHKASVLLRRMGVKARGDGKNAVSLLLPNGSRIVGLPGTDDTTRGFSAVRLLVVDEAARVPDEVLRSWTPMLAVSDGALWMLSTPFGAQGLFHQIWEGGGEGWTRFRVPATECSRIGAGFLEEERAQMGSRMFGQEYLCEFVANGRARFARELVRAALCDVPGIRV
jgi:Helicase